MAVPLILTLLPNPWRPKSPRSVSTRLEPSPAMSSTSSTPVLPVKGCLSRFRRMFEDSDGEWVAGLDVEYTTVLGREKDLKDEERKKPVMI